MNKKRYAMFVAVVLIGLIGGLLGACGTIPQNEYWAEQEPALIEFHGMTCLVFSGEGVTCNWAEWRGQ